MSVRGGLSGAGGTQARFRVAEAGAFGLFGPQPIARPLHLAQLKYGSRAVESGSGDPVIFLHGISLGLAIWAGLLARMPLWRCIAIDMPGHGLADPVDFDRVDLRAWHTEMLISCLDALALNSVHIVGHSYGGLMALWLTLDAPDRVRSVVAIGTPAVAFGAKPDLTLRTLARPVLGSAALAVPMPGALYRRGPGRIAR